MHPFASFFSCGLHGNPVARRYLELFRLSKQYDFLRMPALDAYGGIAYRDGGGVIVHDIVSDELLLFFV